MDRDVLSRGYEAKKPTVYSVFTRVDWKKIDAESE